ncbi:hypothetical protein [Conexibacter sp. SYSU D00693]|uniref:hypothetical protein n=1 Tax=Conexibacter sp. SYSU D00693 TaxID=2812560 RepID=UPI00196A8049|nr:hypothetical protein [Conexibacter sp. SYSU D00693]
MRRRPLPLPLPLTLAAVALGVAAPAPAVARTVTATDVRGPGGLTCWALAVGGPGIECTSPHLEEIGELDTFLRLRPTGSAVLGERGDYPGYGKAPGRLRTGDVWRRGSIRCTLKAKDVLRCTNRSGRGFVLDRRGGRRF